MNIELTITDLRHFKNRLKKEGYSSEFIQPIQKAIEELKSCQVQIGKLKQELLYCSWQILEESRK